MTGRADRKQIIVSLPEALVKEAGHLGVELGLNRGQVIALLLREALDHRGAEAAAGGGS